jgi:hypothetical protein
MCTNMYIYISSFVYWSLYAYTYRDTHMYMYWSLYVYTHIPALGMGM